MNKNVIISNLIQIAEVLDSKQMFNQAERLTDVMVKIAQITTGEEERILQELENESFNSRLKDVPNSTGEDKPETSDTISLIVNGKSVRVPKDIETTKIYDKERFKLNFDPDNNQLFYKSENGKKNVVLDKDGNVREVRPKRYDFTKQIGLRKMFGNWRLPNLNKSIPLEPYLRKELIPDVAKVVRPIGNVAKQTITKPITDTLGAAADDLGIGVPGRDNPFMADAKFDLGPSSDPTPITLKPSEESVEIKAPISLPEPTGAKAVKPKDSSTSGGDGPNSIKIPKDQLKDIKTPDDLLFWSMMVGNDISYSSYDIKKENKYYSKNNKQNTTDFINKLTSSSWVNKINPKIREMKNQAISLLDNKTNTKKEAMNKLHIVNRLYKLAQMFDEMNMPEQADDVTNVMENISDSPEKTAWTNYARTLAKKDPDFIPPVKPKVSAITFLDVTETALSDYHLYKNNKKQLPKLSTMEENQLKDLAKNADRAR